MATSTSIDADHDLRRNPPAATGGPLSRARRFAGQRSWLRPGDPDDAPGRARLLFGLVLVVFPLYHLTLNGRVLLSGQMWAELGDYYGTTRALPLLDQLRVTDAGYVPLPQRLIAGAATTLGTTPDAVPYLYAAVALLGAGLLAGALCLPTFRVLIGSDLLRAVIALAILLVPDFNTKAFTNFTYFAAVLAVVVAARATADRDRDLPRWVWVLPLLMISKPAVLLTLPLVLVAAVVHRRRAFRVVAVASLAAGTLQFWSVLTHPTVIGPTPADSLPHRVVLAGQYALGYLGRFTTHVVSPPSSATCQLIGALVLVLALVAVARSRHPATLIVLGGLYLVATTAATDVLTLGYQGFDGTMSGLEGPFRPAVDRWLFGATTGSLLVVGGLVAVLTEAGPLPRLLRGSRRVPVRPFLGAAAVVVFGAWFVTAGWSTRAQQANTAPGIPLTNVSQWQQLAGRIASDDPVLCVPLNSGWVFGRACGALVGYSNPAPEMIQVVGFEAPAVTPDGGTEPLSLDVPAQVTEGRLASVGLLVRPVAGATIVGGTAVFEHRDGTTSRLTTQEELSPEGGLMQFVDQPAKLYDDVVGVSVSFDVPVELALTNTWWTAPGTVHVMWMGQP